MPMGRTFRRTLSPQIRDRVSCANGGASRGGPSMLQNGGGAGSKAFDVEEGFEQQNVHALQHNDRSSLTSMTGTMAAPSRFSSASLPSTTSSHSDPPLNFPLPCPHVGRTGGSKDRLQKSSRGMFWKRPMLHLLLCIVFGVFMGLLSFCWSDFPSYTRDELSHDLSLVNGFVSNLQREGFMSQGLEITHSGSRDSGNTVSRGAKVIENESMRVNLRLGENGLGISSDETSRAFQLEQLTLVSSEFERGLSYSLDPGRKLLIIVTPTYNRPFQSYYLTRLAHTLRLVPPPLLWLVVEMSSQTLQTASVLMQTGIMYRHLVCRDNVTDVTDPFVHQRNLALEHIEMHQLNGVVYFAADDNVYSQEVFEEMRSISRFGTWLVAMLAEGGAETLLEGPVCDEERVIGWHTNTEKESIRRFHVDMSGFAFNSTILWDTVNWRHRDWQPIRQSDTVEEELQVSTFIEQLVEDEDQMLALPSGCRKVMVWHLHMEAPELPYPNGWSLSNALLPNIPY